MLDMRKKAMMGLLVAISLVGAGMELWDVLKSREHTYPRGDVSGYIAWAAGGATDTTARAISTYARKYLGRAIILQNKTGATGSIATEFVRNQPADGYSLLFNAENPTLYKLMNISQVDYDQYYPVLLIGSQVPVVVVPPHSPYKTIVDFVDDAGARPDKIKLGISGVGGLPFNVATMLQTTSGVSFTKVPFDGDSAILAALMGGHVDVSVVNYSAVAELAKAGQVRLLAVMHDERMKALPDVPTIGEHLPEYQKYFPWGAFVGVFVRKDTPEPIRDTLREAFFSAFQEGRFKLYMDENYILPLGLWGEEAEAYLRRWRSVTAWLLEDAGVTAVPATELGIPRLEEVR